MLRRRLALLVISVIIPTLNEAKLLPSTVSRTRNAAVDLVEIIISDSGSRDDTLDLAMHALPADRVIAGARSRADALNRGARQARGNVLLFLHADSRLPVGFDRLIDRALSNPSIVGGAFDFEFATPPQCGALDRCLLDWVVLCNRIRFRWTGNFYGDQSIFVRRDIFDRIGGFPLLELMEDIELSRRLALAGRTAILRPPILTSPRRFMTRGVVRQFAEDLALLACHSLGAEPRILWRRYNRLNRQAHRPFPLPMDEARLRCAG